jgi:V/A-type H+-transporting ATPase subunit E
MAYESLLKSVEESAEEKERELRQNAQKKADEILQDAKKLAKKIEERTIKEAEDDAGIERNKQLFLAKGRIKKQAFTAREKTFETAFDLAVKHLNSLRQDEKYSDIFKHLTEEIMSSIGEGTFVIHIDPRDLDLCKKTMELMKVSCEIRTDLESIGGLSINSLDGKITISNTIESRLERVREHKRLEIYAKLFG